MQRVNFKRRKVLAFAKDWLWEIDLADMDNWKSTEASRLQGKKPTGLSRYNKGYRYLFVCIDIWSKLLWVEVLKKKTADVIVEAFRSIYAKAKVSPKFISCDEGKEFDNSKVKTFLKSKGTEIYFMLNKETGAPHAERVIRTIKGRLFRYMTEHKTKKFYTVVQNVVDGYNRSKHRTIGMKPIDVTEEHHELLAQKLVPTVDVGQLKFKFNAGDRVRVQMERQTFHRGFTANQYTDETYIIAKKQWTDPPTYRLKSDDEQQLEIPGSYYEQQLLHVS